MYDVYYIGHRQYQCYLNLLLWGCLSGAFGSVDVWCSARRVVEVVGSNLARGKIFTASIGSVDLLYPSVFIYCVNLHQFCEIIFSHLYLSNFTCIFGSTSISFKNEKDGMHLNRTNMRRVLH